MKVEDLIKELEKHIGKKVNVSYGMTFKDISHIEEEETESNIIYLITKWTISRNKEDWKMYCNVCKFPQDDYVGMFMEGEECPQCKSLLPKAKQWFGNGEVDVDLMISAGTVTKEQLIKMYIQENNKNTKVISGFPAVGKSVLTKESHLTVLDSDSSKFSWIEEGIRHPDFPNNYMQHIKDNIGKADYILVSSHDVVRKALEENNIGYTLVYPSIELKDEYLERYKCRGNNEKFIRFIDENWNEFINAIEKETFPKLIKLEKGQFLADVLTTWNENIV